MDETQDAPAHAGSQGIRSEAERLRDRLYYAKTREVRLAQKRAWREANRDKVKEIAARSRLKNVEKAREYRRLYHQATYPAQRERICAKRMERYRQKLAEGGSAFLAEHAASNRRVRQKMKSENPERYRAENAKRHQALKDKNYGILQIRMKSAVRSALKRYAKRGKAGTSWTEIVGYDVETLAKWLKKTIPVGWTWDDYIAGRLQIDHIVPVSVFNFSDPSDHDFKRCWGLKNLRLLPAAENMNKRAKLSAPFQPSLL